MIINHQWIKAVVIVLLLFRMVFSVWAQVEGQGAEAIQEKIDSLSKLPFSPEVFQQFKQIERQAINANHQEKEA
ncbi:MAG: hypothetical protein AAF985_24620, partial [Bacteroidota bacterium]